MIKQKTLMNILKNKGATLNYKGVAKNYKKGYQVSFQDLHIININNINELLEKINTALNNATKCDFVGIWVDDGLVYIDYSKRFLNLENAIEYGTAKKQISIFDWANKNCIYLKKGA